MLGYWFQKEASSSVSWYQNKTAQREQNTATTLLACDVNLTTLSRGNMATISFADRENVGIVPALKARPRLQSAPDVMIKTPLTGLKFHTPLQSHRKGLGAFNKKITATPAINRQEKSQKTQKTDVKCDTQAKVEEIEEYPDIEKLFPYDPLEFEKDMLEYVVPIGCLALSGLAYPNMPCLPEDDFEPSFEELMSPLKMPESSDHCAELDAFLQTINELTVDFPSECY